MDFDLNQGTFTFIDREDLKVAISDITNWFMMAGAAYGTKFLVDGHASSEALLKLLETNP